MALGAVQNISLAGLTPNYVVPAASETVQPDTGLFLHVKNANAAPCVVTFTDPGRTPSGSAATNPSVSVPATTGDRMIAIPRSLVNTTTGLIGIGFSVQSSVSVALLRMGS